MRLSELVRADRIPGGRGDDRPDSDFDTTQLQKGVKVEMEHTDDPAIAKEIAKDHLTEDPEYYDKLELIDPHHAKKENVVKISDHIRNSKNTLRKAGRYEVMEQIIPMKDLLKLEDILEDDEQTWDLAVQVYRKIGDKLQLSSGESEALKRLMGSVHKGKGWKPAMHRNNIFKAANSLGVKLPSHMF